MKILNIGFLSVKNKQAQAAPLATLAWFFVTVVIAGWFAHTDPSNRHSFGSPFDLSHNTVWRLSLIGA